MYAVSNGNVSKELSFRSGKTVLSVFLVFEEEVHQKTKSLKSLNGPDWLSARIRPRRLVRINPHKLTKSHNFCEKISVPQATKHTKAR